MTARSPDQGYPRAGRSERNYIPDHYLYHQENATNVRISQSPQNGNRPDIVDIAFGRKPLSRQSNSAGSVQQNNGADPTGGQSTYRSEVERKPTPYYNPEVGEDVARAVDKVHDIDNRLEEFDQQARTIPQSVSGVEANMAYNSRAVEELEMRNKLHSAKIHELERELQNVRMDNQAIRGRPGNNYDGYGPANGAYNQDAGRQPAYQEHPAEAGDPRWREAQQQVPNKGTTQYNPAPDVPRDKDGRRIYEYDQFKQFHHSGELDGETYWGINKFYNPQQVTAYRREHVPYYMRKEERDQEEEWRRKKQLEEDRMLLDMNKYFHDSKYFYEMERVNKPDEEYFTKQNPGGLLFIRFNNKGYDNVNLALRELQTITKSYGGYVMGIAKSNNIIVIEGDQGWYDPPKSLQRDPSVGVDHRRTDNAMAMFWFPTRDKAFQFLGTSHKNRFSDKNNFPTPQSYESHFVPLLTAPAMRSQDTLMIVELPDAYKYSEEDLGDFAKEAAEEIKRFLPNSHPFFAAAVAGGDLFKTGSLFKGRSKVFLTFVESMRQVGEIWRQGIIQNLLRKYRLHGPINVSGASIRDWSEY